MKMSEIEMILSLLTENKTYKSFCVSRKQCSCRFSIKIHNTESEITIRHKGMIVFYAIYGTKFEMYLVTECFFLKFYRT